MTAAALTAVIGAYAWAAYRYQLVLLMGGSDTWAHLGAIRRTMEAGPFPGDVFYQGLPTPPYYSLAHILFAWIAGAADLPAHVVFVDGAPVIAALVIVAVFLWLVALTGDPRIAVVGAAVELLVAMPASPWTSLPYPRHVALAPFYLAFYAYVCGRPQRRLGWLLAAGASLGLCLASHLLTGGLCLIGLALHELALTRRGSRSIGPLFLVAAMGLVIASPWLASLAVAATQAAPTRHRIFSLVWESWQPFESQLWLRIMRPSMGVTILPAPLWIAFAAGVLVSILRVMNGSASRTDRYALMATATGCLLALTPLFGVALSLFGVWAPRLVLVVPFSLLCAQGVVGLASLVRAAGSSRFGLPLAILSLALLVLMGEAAITSVRSPVVYWEALSAGLRREGPLGCWDLAARLAPGPRPVLVLADPETSYLMPYTLGAYVVAMPAAHGSAYVDHDKGEQAARAYFSPGTSMRDRMVILNQHGVDMIVAATESQWPQEGAQATVLGYMRQHPVFAEAGRCGSVVLMRYQGSRALAPP